MNSNSPKPFGRLGVSKPAQAVKPNVPMHKLPLVKQLGGVAIGVAIALGLLGANNMLMRKAGHDLNRKFLEQANSTHWRESTPAAGDADLTAVHLKCLGVGKLARLTPAQSRVSAHYIELASGEASLARTAAYVECLARDNPARFCRSEDREHLVQAVKEFYRQQTQMKEAWSSVLRAPGAAQGAAIVGGARNSSQLAMIGMPSAVASPSMIGALQAAAAQGYISASDFGGFAGFGVPDELDEAFGKIQPVKGACR